MHPTNMSEEQRLHIADGELSLAQCTIDQILNPDEPLNLEEELQHIYKYIENARQALDVH